MANPPECSECGDTMSPKNRDKGGQYRDKCWGCILEAAPGDPDDAKRQEPPEYE